MTSHCSRAFMLLALLSAAGAAACSSSGSTTPAGTTTPTATSTAPTPPTSAPVACAATVTTTLPGITARVKNERCDFTLAQAAAGIKIDWEIVVEKDLPTLYADSGVTGAVQTELKLFAELSGQGQSYCLCDTGPRAWDEQAINVAAGVYSGSFEWDGKNWTGPSDTGNKKGPAFPEGSYVLKLHSEGSHTPSAPGLRSAKDFDLDVTIPIVLVK